MSFSRILRALDASAERYALLLFYVMLVFTMFAEVVRRELLSYSSVWGEEIVRYAFIYLTWIGAAAAVKERGHIRIDVLLHYLPPRGKAAIYIFGDLVMLAVACLALFFSCETVAVSVQYGSVSHGLGVSMAWFLAAVPLGFLLMLFRLLQSLCRDIRDLRAGTPVYEGEKLFD